jgi:hypothetical protein
MFRSRGWLSSQSPCFFKKNIEKDLVYSNKIRIFVAEIKQQRI